jgi:hypothetical protein
MKSEHLITDVRKMDGKPLRQSWELPFLSGPISASTYTAGLLCLYEAQTSIVVTGVDNRVWTAYCIVDTYFGAKKTLQHYHEENGPSAQIDPLAAGQIPATPSSTLIWTPREYFFKIVAIRINEARRAWRVISDEVEGSVKQYVHSKYFLTHSTEEAKMGYFCYLSE